MRPLLLLAFVSLSASAGICPKVEYADLESYKPDELLALRCQYRSEAQAVGSLNPQSLSGSNRQWSDTVRCYDEMGRMARILTTKHGITAPDVTKYCK